MYRHTRALLGLLLLLAIPALACGVGGEEPTATAPPPTATTEAATATPTRAPLPTEPPIPAPEGSLEYGDTVNGVVPEDDASAWSFIGVEGERVDVTVTPAGDELDAIIDVLNSAGETILSGGPIDASFATEEIRDLAIPANDEYFIVVTGFGGSGGPYELTLDEASAAPSPAGPQALALGGTLDAFLDAGEIDVYTYASPDGAPVTLVVEPEEDLDVVIELYGPGGGLTQSEDSSFGREEFTFTPPTGGNQVIHVGGYEADDSGNYTLTLLPTQGNGNAGSTILTSDTLETTDEEHFYPFTSAAGETATIVVEPEGDLDVVVEVWNDDTDTLLDTIDESFGEEEVAFTAQEAANYYFRVTGFENATGRYSVTLTGSPTIIFELATGDVVNGGLGPDGFINYTIRLDPGREVRLRLECDDTLDGVIEMYDLNDTLLAEVDEGFSGDPEQLTFIAPDEVEDGTIFIIGIRDFANAGGGAFTLLVERP